MQRVQLRGYAVVAVARLRLGLLGNKYTDNYAFACYTRNCPSIMHSLLYTLELEYWLRFFSSLAKSGSTCPREVSAVLDEPRFVTISWIVDLGQFSTSIGFRGMDNENGYGHPHGLDCGRGYSTAMQIPA